MTREREILGLRGARDLDLEAEMIDSAAGTGLAGLWTGTFEGLENVVVVKASLNIRAGML